MIKLRRPTLAFVSKRTNDSETPKREIKNVVVFGETGVGKSSLINLIAGEKVSETSSSAAGCTLEYKRHTLTLDDQQFAFWDTAGLGEGTQGTVPAERAEAYLKQLLRDLTKASGVDLLIYCVRGTRVRTALLTNYHLFYSAICRKKVPIAIVITGLENQEGNMDTWWLKNRKEFTALQMHFTNYACVTTLEPSSMENPILWERRKVSRAALINLLTNTCRTEQWRPTERSWVDTVFSDVRAMLSLRDSHAARVVNVIICDVSQDAPVTIPNITRSVTFHNPISLSRSSIWSMSFRSPLSLARSESQSKLPFNSSMKCTAEHLFRVYQVQRKLTLSKGRDETKKDLVVKLGADLLIFCVEKDDEDVGLQWERFNHIYGGDLSPQIVVVVGAADQLSAEGWWNDAVCVTKYSGASIAYWPINQSVTATEAAKDQLIDLIHTRCIDCSKASFTGDKRIFRRATSPPISNKHLFPPWMRPLPTRSDLANAGLARDQLQDPLTKWNVWKQISDE